MGARDRSGLGEQPGPGFGPSPDERSARRESPVQRHERRAQAHREAVAADPESVAREICLASLTQQARTRAQLAALLARREIPAEVAGTVLDRLAEVGLVDDGDFARGYVAGRSAAGQARRSLRQGLARAGVETEVAEAAVGLVDHAAERATAQRLVARRVPSLAGLPEPVRARRLVGMLARKGYDPGLCYAVVREQCRLADEQLDEAAAE